MVLIGAAVFFLRRRGRLRRAARAGGERCALIVRQRAGRDEAVADSRSGLAFQTGITVFGNNLPYLLFGQAAALFRLPLHYLLLHLLDLVAQRIDFRRQPFLRQIALVGGNHLFDFGFAAAGARAAHAVGNHRGNGGQRQKRCHAAQNHIALLFAAAVAPSFFQPHANAPCRP